MAEVTELLETFKRELAPLSKTSEVLHLKSQYLGKKGMVSTILSSLKKAPLEMRQKIGPEANALKEEIQRLVGKKLTHLEISEMNRQMSQDKIDIGFQDSVKQQGIYHAGLHPVTLIRQEIEDIFLSMGFSVLDGPHIEDEFHNFEALNIPSEHPARDMQDTFWFPPSGSGKEKKKKKWLLRTHTSSTQVRGMKAHRPPFRFIAPGKVFRCERTDASHESVFHQVEGMMVDKDVSVAHLIYFMKVFLSEVFETEVEVRPRPGFFPFVEPGLELDIRCLLCSGRGCSVCGQVGWLELLPCGMIHSNVLRAGGIDPRQWNGFAFGLGLDRLVMMKYGIDDIRHLHGADLRFISQFQTY